MALLPIISIPDPRLRAKALPVDQVDDGIRHLMDDMMETMRYKDRGIGLAANQVGILKRVVVIDIGRDYHPHPLKMANPEIFWRSDEPHSIEESCLSIPDQWASVKRHNRVKVRYLNENNVSQEIEAEGLLSICLQHELDHLDGILFIDHLSEVKRRMLVTRALKAKRNHQHPQPDNVPVL
jgi:peptide deformylase